MEQNDLTKRFTYHTPAPHQVPKYSTIRELAKHFSNVLNELVPDGREKALAITKLEEAVMWANAGIARN